MSAIFLLVGTITGFLASTVVVPGGLVFLMVWWKLNYPPRPPGSVRYSNFSGLEAVLYAMVMLAQLAGFVLGAALIWHGFTAQNSSVRFMGVEPGKGKRIICGIGLILSGLACPRVMNWMVATVRDANLLS